MNEIELLLKLLDGKNLEDTVMIDIFESDSVVIDLQIKTIALTEYKSL